MLRHQSVDMSVGNAPLGSSGDRYDQSAMLLDGKVRVGVMPVVDRTAGGTFQYSSIILRALDDLRTSFDPIMVHDHPGALAVAADAGAAWDVLPFGQPTPRQGARRTLARAIGEPATTRLVAAVRRSMDRAAPTRSGPRSSLEAWAHPRAGSGDWLRNRGVDLMLYPAPTNFAFECGLPYVSAVHDLQHRIQPEFPEVSANGEWEAREYLYSNIFRTAQTILVDSEVGREDVLEYYGKVISPDRVRSLPFVPPPYLARPADTETADARARFGIPGDYLLFPAQLWPHKNHRRVIEAVAMLHKQDFDVTVVMTGSATGDIRSQVRAELDDLIGREGLEQQVLMLGYVDDPTIASLYAGAAGVLLPTFFGPTNIPVVEAWAMGVPVLSSDIRGIREQCGRAALLVDPRSTEAIADGVRRLCEDDALRQELISAGSDRLAGNDLEAFTTRLATILDDVAGLLPASVVREVAR